MREPTEAGARGVAVRRVLAVAAIVGGLWATGCFGQSTPAITINPAMTRGPASAPVTIVEFSDYQ